MDKKLKEYARLAVRQGVNLQKGQTLLLRAPVECAPFARLIAEEAYAAGAREVMTDWMDDTMTRLRYLNAADEVFDRVRPWIKERYDTLAAEDFALITVYAEDPESLKGVDADRIRRSSVASSTALKDYYDKMMRSDFSWCVISVPVLSWAKKVFPEKSEGEAMEALWEAIYETLRIDGSGSAVEKWAAHTARLHEKCEKLNALALKSLHYQTGLGTDFTVDLPDGYLFLGGAEKNRRGTMFIANMPTEEIFTAPQKYSGSGVICASRPLCLNGNLVKGIRFTVEKGKIVKAEAEEGLEVLQKALDIDEGARYFGELALVEYDSPISKQGIVYYNTLFDENAACHIAFGNAYPDCVKGAENFSGEQYESVGLNASFAHEDFMIGTADLSLVGTTKTGEKVEIFKNGNFAL